jgi:hypothetical protein
VLLIDFNGIPIARYRLGWRILVTASHLFSNSKNLPHDPK